jgi:hypothetical protein
MATQFNDCPFLSPEELKCVNSAEDIREIRDITIKLFCQLEPYNVKYSPLHYPPVEEIRNVPKYKKYMKRIMFSRLKLSKDAQSMLKVLESKKADDIVYHILLLDSLYSLHSRLDTYLCELFKQLPNIKI